MLVVTRSRSIMPNSSSASVGSSFVPLAKKAVLYLSKIAGLIITIVTISPCEGHKQLAFYITHPQQLFRYDISGGAILSIRQCILERIANVKTVFYDGKFSAYIMLTGCQINTNV